MSVLRVLFDGTGNVCRSPLGERLLASQLPAGTFAVSSVGRGPMTGFAMVPEAAAHLEAYGGSPDGFLTRQPTGAMVEQSDLVLPAMLDLTPTAAGPAVVVRTAAQERSRATLGDYDTPDPYGRGDDAYALAARTMAVAVERTDKGLGG